MSTMYDPRQPNVYQDIQYAYHCARRALEEKKEAEEARRNSSASQDQGTHTDADTRDTHTHHPSIGTRGSAATSPVDDAAANATAHPSSSSSTSSTTLPMTLHGSATGDAAAAVVMPPPPPPQAASTAMPAPVGGPRRQPTPTLLPNLTAEELHHRRIQRSADMGVQRAVELQREGLEMEHKKRKLEGTDARSRISSLLSHMRRRPAPCNDNTTDSALSSSSLCSATAPLAAQAAELAESCEAHGQHASVPAEADTSGAPHDECDTARGGGARGTEHEMRAPMCPPPPSESAAALVFRPSPLAAGGFVLTPSMNAAPSSSSSHSSSLALSSSLSLRGKPSSTLLLRFGCPDLLTRLLPPPPDTTASLSAGDDDFALPQEGVEEGAAAAANGPL